MDKWWLFCDGTKFLNYIKNDDTFLNGNHLKKITKNGNLVAYKHTGFWQCTWIH